MNKNLEVKYLGTSVVGTEVVAVFCDPWEGGRHGKDGKMSMNRASLKDIYRRMVVAGRDGDEYTKLIVKAIGDIDAETAKLAAMREAS